MLTAPSNRGLVQKSHKRKSNCLYPQTGTRARLHAMGAVIRSCWALPFLERPGNSLRLRASAAILILRTCTAVGRLEQIRGPIGDANYRDEARRIAANIAKLPVLAPLGRPAGNLREVMTT